MYIYTYIPIIYTNNIYIYIYLHIPIYIHIYIYIYIYLYTYRYIHQYTSGHVHTYNTVSCIIDSIPAVLGVFKTPAGLAPADWWSR